MVLLTWGRHCMLLVCHDLNSPLSQVPAACLPCCDELKPIWNQEPKSISLHVSRGYKSNDKYTDFGDVRGDRLFKAWDGRRSTQALFHLAISLTAPLSCSKRQSKLSMSKCKHLTFTAPDNPMHTPEHPCTPLHTLPTQLIAALFADTYGVQLYFFSHFPELCERTLWVLPSEYIQSVFQPHLTAVIRLRAVMSSFLLGHSSGFLALPFPPVHSCF